MGGDSRGKGELSGRRGGGERINGCLWPVEVNGVYQLLDSK